MVSDFGSDIAPESDHSSGQERDRCRKTWRRTVRSQSAMEKEVSSSDGGVWCGMGSSRNGLLASQAIWHGSIAGTPLPPTKNKAPNVGMG